MRATILFETKKLSYNGRKSIWKVDREFNDNYHLDNFINYICRTKGYLLDEVYVYDKGQIQNLR